MQPFNNRTIVLGRVILSLCLLSVLGCGNGLTPITTAKVTGKATFGGKPLEDYQVTLYCEDGKAQEPATGLVKADGSFVMGVRKEGDGAIVGKNKVWLTYAPQMPEMPPGKEGSWTPPPAKVKLPQKYLSAETSGLTIDVPSSCLADYNLDLK